MKIFYDERGKHGKYRELQDVEDFPKMKKIKGIFAYSGPIADFNYSLENVIDGSLAFYRDGRLKSFNSNLSKLENGANMFSACTNLTSFTSDLSNLTDGHMMFHTCWDLTSFTSDLSSLTNGFWMFDNCKSLTSFTSKLGSLKSGIVMFNGCKLNEESLRNIADNINDISDLDKNIDADWTYEVSGETKTISSLQRGRINIGHDESVTQEVLKYCGNTLIDKGWTVYFNGTLYEYVSPYDISEANGYIPDAYKNGSDSWNTVVLTPNMDVLKISIVNEKGEMLNDE